MGDPETQEAVAERTETASPCGLLAANQQVDYGRCSPINLELISVSVNEHRRKAPTWGSPRIPECMYLPDPFPSACITKR